MEAIELLKEAEKMIKELQDAYVRHDGAVALRRKIRKFVASQQSVLSDVCNVCGAKILHHPIGTQAICSNKHCPTRR